VDALVALDHALFYRINHDLQAPVLDLFMVVVTTSRWWALPAVLCALLAAWRGGTKTRWTLAAIVVAVAFTDLVVAQLLKPSLARARPPFALEDVRILVDVRPGPSWPSSHAANMAAAATCMRWLGPRLLGVGCIAALMSGVSRVYVGAHFPLDVLCGWCVGVLLACVVLLMMGRWRQRATLAQVSAEN